MTINVPPHNREAERIVLGGLLIDNTYIDTVASILPPEAFDFSAHRLIYRAVIALHEQNIPVDFILLGDELKKRKHVDKVGGMAYISKLLTEVSAITNITHYAGIVKDKYLLRRLISVCSRVMDRCYDEAGEADGQVEYAQRCVSDLIDVSAKSTISDLRDLVQSSVAEMDAIAAGDQIVPGVPTGFNELDKIIGGLHAGELVIIGARTSVGKTTISLDIARHVATAGYGVLDFSLEMSKSAITHRLIAAKAGVSLHNLHRGLLNEDRRAAVHRIKESLEALPIYIGSPASLRIQQLFSRAKVIKQRHNISVLIVDYLQLIKAPKKTAENRQQDVAEIARRLKEIASELDITVIALSQLRRSEKGISLKTPGLSDLRESGEIEQAADKVIFLHNPQKRTHLHRNIRIKGTVAKHKNGPLGTFDLIFNGSSATFKDAVPKSDDDEVDDEVEDEVDVPDWVK
ncbi:MAG: replicative DNA helicase [Deltaproteobacteria bacterium]|nr:replicative DNA helicase [Deltaproteobacteria bacterium]